MDYSKWDPEMAARIKALMEDDDSENETQNEANVSDESYFEELKKEAVNWNWRGFVDSLNGMFAQLSSEDIRDVSYYVSTNLAQALGGTGYYENKVFEKFYFDVEFEDYGKKNFAEALAETAQKDRKNIKYVLSGLLKKVGLIDILVDGQKLGSLIEKVDPDFRFADDLRGKEAKFVNVKRVEYNDSSLKRVLKELADKKKISVCSLVALPKIVSDERKRNLKSRIICDDNSVDVALDTLTEMNKTLMKMRADAHKNKAVNPEDYEYIEQKNDSSEIIKDLNNAIETFNLFLTARIHNKTPRFSKAHRTEKKLRKSIVKSFLEDLAKAYEDAKAPKEIPRSPGISENTLCELFIMCLKQKHMYLPGINPYKNGLYNGIRTKEQIIKKVNELAKSSEINGETEKMLVLLYLFFKVFGENAEKLEKEMDNGYNKISRKQKWKHPTATIFKSDVEKCVKNVKQTACDFAKNKTKM